MHKGQSKRIDKHLKSMQEGGNINGPSHDDGGVVIEAEGGEYIIKKDSVNSQTESVLDYINTYGKLPTIKNARNRGKK